VIGIDTSAPSRRTVSTTFSPGDMYLILVWKAFIATAAGSPSMLTSSTLTISSFSWTFAAAAGPFGSTFRMVSRSVFASGPRLTRIAPILRSPVRAYCLRASAT